MEHARARIEGQAHDGGRAQEPDGRRLARGRIERHESTLCQVRPVEDGKERIEGERHDQIGQGADCRAAAARNPRTAVARGGERESA